MTVYNIVELENKMDILCKAYNITYQIEFSLLSAQITISSQEQTYKLVMNEKNGFVMNAHHQFFLDKVFFDKIIQYSKKYRDIILDCENFEKPTFFDCIACKWVAKEKNSVFCNYHNKSIEIFKNDESEKKWKMTVKI